MAEQSESTLYGPQQSRFARYLERRERRRPDPIAREIRRRVLAGLSGDVIEVGSGDGRSFEHYPAEVQKLGRRAGSDGPRERRTPGRGRALPDRARRRRRGRTAGRGREFRRGRRHGPPLQRSRPGLRSE
jgi:hypothetical protein